jgi:hypothetical protein
MSTIHLALVVLSMCVVGGLMALSLVYMLEKKEDNEY